MPKPQKTMEKTAASGSTGLLLPDVPLEAILSFLKDTRGVVSWNDDDFRSCLKLDAKGTQQILQILEMQGYVHREGNSDEWLTTSAGESISHSRVPKLSLEKVQEALDALKEQIAAVNRDKRSPCRVMEAVAFGDFLSGRARVQAADVGVKLDMRNLKAPDETTEEAQKQEFMKRLGGRSRFLILQPYREWMSRRSHRGLR